MESTDRNSLMALVKACFQYTNFQETHNHSINCYGCQIFKLEEKVENMHKFAFTLLSKL